MRLRKLRCSFCRKTEDRVAKLVAGARGYICDECAAAAVRIMEQTPPARSQRLSLVHELKERWQRFRRDFFRRHELSTGIG